mmetsp:Transcript_22824/g.37561  ORF Transcript_22824/g.37561 Transcript_22824/m.37561 type:complete len:479 (-) Transcript_22824:156-1592(-)
MSLSFRPRPIDIFRRLHVVNVSDEGQNVGLSSSRVSVPASIAAISKSQIGEKAHEIPIPAFVTVDTGDRRSQFIRGPQYIKYTGPSKSAEERVEYDLDSDDERFLEFLKEKCGGRSLNDEQFEKLIDRLEKLSGALGLGHTVDIFTFRHTFPSIQLEVLDDVYSHWRKKRVALGKPLYRQFQPPPSADDTRPDVAFRPREIKSRPVLKKSQKKNDQQALMRLRNLRKNLERVRTMADLVLQRERKKQQLSILSIDCRNTETERKFALVARDPNHKSLDYPSSSLSSAERPSKRARRFGNWIAGSDGTRMYSPSSSENIPPGLQKERASDSDTESDTDSEKTRSVPSAGLNKTHGSIIEPLVNVASKNAGRMDIQSDEDDWQILFDKKSPSNWPCQTISIIIGKRTSGPHVSQVVGRGGRIIQEEWGSTTARARLGRGGRIIIYRQKKPFQKRLVSENTCRVDSEHRWGLPHHPPFRIP